MHRVLRRCVAAAEHRSRHDCQPNKPAGVHGLDQCRAQRSGKGPLGERDTLCFIRCFRICGAPVSHGLRNDHDQVAAQAERDALDALSTGIITFDAAHRVLFANAAARAQAENLSLRLDAGTEMSGPPVVIKALLTLIGDAVRGGAGGTTCLSRADGGEEGVTVVPVRGPGARPPLAPSGGASRRDGAAGRRVAQPRGGERIAAAARHDLTAAELRWPTKRGRANGMAAAAATLGISPNTLKSHTKRIYAKIGIGGYAELV